MAQAHTMALLIDSTGEELLGKDFFKENKGHFWGMHETRPFMNAKYHCAHCLIMMGRPDEGIKHLKELLKLNPNDNRGVRYLLTTWLLITRRFDEYLSVYKKYRTDPSAGSLQARRWNSMRLMAFTIRETKRRPSCISPTAFCYGGWSQGPFPG